jgi:hypothetical protein
MVVLRRVIAIENGSHLKLCMRMYLLVNFDRNFLSFNQLIKNKNKGPFFLLPILNCTELIFSIITIIIGTSI